MVAEVARVVLSLLLLVSVTAGSLAPTHVPSSSTRPTDAPSQNYTAAPTDAPSHAPTPVLSNGTSSPSAATTIQPSSASSSRPTPAVVLTPEQLCERNLTYTQIADLMTTNASVCPVVIRDYSGRRMVYEMAGFGRYHPHGKIDIFDYCGQDMTQVFEEGPHRFQPFQGMIGMMEGHNRSDMFVCVGTFVNSTASPTPVRAPAPSPANATIYPCLTKGKEYQLRQLILNAYHAIPLTVGSIERAAFNGGLVRLAFHDATTYSKITGEGGPDGCINFDDPDNAGLINHTLSLETMWTPYKDRISRADFWYLAAITVIENAGGPVIPFRYGRKDCTPENFARQNDLGRLPSPDRDWFYVRGYWNYALGFSDREITALFGAHVLGRARPQDSGFDGPWVSGPNPGLKFDNQFYLGLELVDWKKEKNNFTGFPNRFQWNQGGAGTGLQMFIGSDISLLVTNPNDPACTSSLIDTSILSASAAVPSDPECIKNNATFSIVDEYSHSQANFFRDFSAAYQKLCEMGYLNGSLIPSGTCFPGAQTFPNDPPVPGTISGGTQTNRVGLSLIVVLCLGLLV